MTDEQLFAADESFAAGWFVEDPLAQGALKFAAVLILDALDDARREIAAPEPDLGDYGPLGILPEAVRAAMTPLLLDRLKAAATIIGWKLAQPGDAIRPGCVAEELALEMIRQEAVDALELIDAPRVSINATRGVFEVCQDDDVLDLFEMEEPGDAGIARLDPINIQMGKADMRIASWFDPFYGGSKDCAAHPLYAEKPARSRDVANIAIVDPESVLLGTGTPYGARFRVSLRMWDDPEPGETEVMPSHWLYYLDAPTADAARAMALERFPHGAVQSVAFDAEEEVLMDRDEVARLSIDVQRIGLSQSSKSGPTFHIVGDLDSEVPKAQMGRLAGHLSNVFSNAIVAQDGRHHVFAVTIKAESFEEAEADLFQAMIGFATKLGLDGDLVNGMACGQGDRDHDQLIAEIKIYRNSLPRTYEQ
jgi:hypothetical protein